MNFIADLHLHSKYSRATSPQMNAEHLAKAGKEKGLNLLGTGDFTHPKYFDELKKQLLFDESTGFYKAKADEKNKNSKEIFFTPTAELSFIYKQDGKGRKVHLLYIAPDFETVSQFNSEVDKWGRRDYDGRPIFGKTAIEAVEMAKSVDKKIEVIPAHIWTPWFGIFGSMGGFNTMKEAFQEKEKEIHAIETGLSSDIEMNAKINFLKDTQLLSFSDSHSPWPWRIGREATIFNIKNYDDLIKAIKTGNGLESTIEVDPNYGKYHFDGHRNCNIVFSPEESIKNNNICPVCKKPLTLGVEHRINELADVENPKPKQKSVKLLPLAELISSYLGVALTSKKIFTLNYEIMNSLKCSELDVLLNVPEDDLKKIADENLISLIMKNRNGEIKFKPGYDGEYGIPLIKKDEKNLENYNNAHKKSKMPLQKALTDF